MNIDKQTNGWMINFFQIFYLFGKVVDGLQKLYHNLETHNEPFLVLLSPTYIQYIYTYM